MKTKNIEIGKDYFTDYGEIITPIKYNDLQKTYTCKNYIYEDNTVYYTGTVELTKYDILHNIEF